MHLKELEISGFKSFAKKSNLKFNAPISAIVGPNGSGKSNIAEAFRFVLGEQSIKSMRGKRGEDLIFNGTNSVPKQNRASVKVVFDNSAKKLPIDFDEVILERVVHRDGANQYLINGSEVRLKDVIELLASANIGSSGHHIISQGEADRILNANSKERKAILEDALGLKIFQYKKIESEKKLVKTEENIAQVQSLRKEIAPHIKFLKKQIEKIEEGEKLRAELFSFYKTYLKIESEYLKQQKKELFKNIDAPKKRLNEIEEEIKKLEEQSKDRGQNEYTNQIRELEKGIFDLTKEKEGLLKELGRIEGQISSLIMLEEKEAAKNNAISVTKDEFLGLKKQIGEFYTESENISDVGVLKSLIKKITDTIAEFLNKKTVSDEGGFEIRNEIAKNKQRNIEINNQIESIKNKETDLKTKISDLRQKLDADKSSSLEAEKKIVVLMSEKNQIQQEISKHAIAYDAFNRDENSFKQELTEAAVLVGREVLNYDNEPLNLSNSSEIISTDGMVIENRENQSERRKKLERLKIKVEESGIGISDDVVKEYKDVTERDLFLIKEIEDLEKSSASLKLLIEELGQKIENEFHDGVQKINKEFQSFFSLMFGGGSASITIVKTEVRKRRDTDLEFDPDAEISTDEESEKPEEGIEIKVNLPRKKISGLMMLSGGERALTSIALLFAISQVNPPPFIILDETDAALDEANSRKYGDMIENLSKNSQLILITHNRETMSRAGILYGVTMMSGVSQLLSVAFDEGTQWAK